MMVFHRNLLFQGFIFRFHVSFRGCIWYVLLLRLGKTSIVTSQLTARHFCLSEIKELADHNWVARRQWVTKSSSEIPSRERSHISPWEKENHFQKWILMGWYVNSQEGNIFDVEFSDVGTLQQLEKSSNFFSPLLMFVGSLFSGS